MIRTGLCKARATKMVTDLDREMSSAEADASYLNDYRLKRIDSYLHDAAELQCFDAKVRAGYVERLARLRGKN